MMHLIRNCYSAMRQKVWEPESVSTKDEVPESFSENGEVDEVFKKYISHRLDNATKGGYDYTLSSRRMKCFVLNDPLFRHDMNKMSIEQRLYLVEEFIKLCSFHGAQGKRDGASTTMNYLADYFYPSLLNNREISADQVRRFVDLCWQNNPCNYIFHRKLDIPMRHWPDVDKEKYAASKELDAFTKCIELNPLYARSYADLFPKETIQKIFSLNRRTEIFKESVSFPYCNDEGNEKTRKYAKEGAERLAKAWSPDRSIFDSELPLWKRCGLTQADLNEIQEKL